MAESKADLILHPIRMRIIQSLLSGGRQTTLQLAERLADVPQATMYRHLNKLLQTGLLTVAEERKVRGTTEKVYALAENGGELTPADVTEASREEHLSLFMKLAASLIGDFGEYVAQDRYDLAEDGFSFRQHQLYLTDEEYKELLAEMRKPLARHAGNGPGGGRRRRTITTVVVPEQRNGTTTTTRRGNDDDDE
ncbi:transcriptional regulator [Cohnella xylanilytica]|uniref:helix-turn-helix domain-containing protein n=1 Tax=Cohnella xylanilytica TaxID=557555 RepID=UPI001B25341F|nr:helix-turn-helix domain-containing protein [Cohnella xylanilytica]GIO13591.1 transcriptional regulator [Cohnella xylanilytica]